MAQFGQDLVNFNGAGTVRIISSESVETYTVYIIEVNIGPYVWTVRHRYSDFHDLHEKLVASRKLDKNLLPPKKVFGNQSEAFIKKRQNDLEAYLQTVLYFVADRPPSSLASFLDFNLYEIHGITQAMAEELYNKGDILLQTKEVYRTTPLQLYALTERLKLPEPTCESGDVKRDIGHILDFITRLKHLQICGGKPVGTSDIDMNQLKFDLTLFKSLHILELLKVNVSRIIGVDTIKETLQRLSVNHSVSAIKDLLLQDLPHWKAEDGSLVITPWEHVRYVDFSRNTIAEIDDSIQLLPKTVELNLSHNKIQTIQHLQHLSHMTYLDLSHNAVEVIEALHSKLGNLKTLNLAGNKLQTLKGLSKMFSLENLDVSDNQISLIEEVKPVSGLPCLENFLLLGNPVTITLDYRRKTLAMFGERVNEVCLDREKPSQKELDTVAVLQAIQKSKDKARGIPAKKSPRNASSSSLSQSHSPSASASYQQSSGNQVRKPVPLMQRYKLYDRFGVDSGRSGVLGSCSSNVQGSITSPSLGQKPESSQPKNSTDWSSIQDSELINSQSTQNHEKLTDSGFPTGSNNTSSRISSQENTAPVSLPSALQLISVTKLPTHKSETFTAWLHTRLFGTEDYSVTTTEKIVFVLWCPLIQYSNIDVLIPACVVTTQRRLFILQVKSVKSSFEDIPELETFYILPLSNIQQVLVGLCYSYVRVEESFVGQSGTFAFLPSDSDEGKEFYEELNLACEAHSDNGMLDVKNLSQNSDLSRQIFDMEEENGMCTGRVAFAAHVRGPQTGSLLYLVLSENQVYILKTDCIFWPKPTFNISVDEKELRFEIAQQFSVDGKISEIRTYAEEVLKINQEPPLTPTHNIRYEEFGLSMMFHELLGSHKFDFYFLSSKSRDFFLDRLTNLRSEHAHRLSPTTREEPEGGNEASDTGTNELKGKTKTFDTDRNSDSDDCGSEDDEGEEDKYLSADEVVDRVNKVLHVKPPRKLRSKTEIVISKPAVDESGTKDIPSYTWHYLSPELVSHLTTCVQQYTLLQPLSCKLKPLSEMTGETVARYFHENVVPVGIEGEELHHILWTNVVPYTNPSDEIVTCVMLSNRAVYLVSDRVIPRTPGRPSWMTHARHASDSVIGLQAKMADKHHSAGILHRTERSIVKPYCILEFSEIYQVNVGLFDQCFRLTGGSRETVFTFLTRSSEMTSVFMKNLSSMLSLFIASPMLDKSSSDLEQDFYKEVNKRTKTTLEGLEYVHPSKVKFCYPGDEAISDLLFIINEHLKTVSLKVGREHILTYILGYRVQGDLKIVSPVMLEPISIILTNDCLCFVTEDLVSYPLPDFVRGLPATPPQHVSDIKKVEYLKYIKQSQTSSREITLVFSDEKEDIILVPDHYSLQDTNGRDSPPEIPVRLLIQSEREMNKLLLLLQNQWREKHQGVALPIVTA